MNKVVRTAVVAGIGAFAAAGCASRSEDVAAAYVSPAQYAS